MFASLLVITPRRTAATAMAEINNITAVKLQRIGRWSSMEIAAVYIANNPHTKARTISKLHDALDKFDTKQEKKKKEETFQDDPPTKVMRTDSGKVFHFENCVFNASVDFQ